MHDSILLQACDDANHQIQLGLADCFKQLNQFDAMLQPAQNAVALKPDNYKANLAVGEALVEVGKTEHLSTT